MWKSVTRLIINHRIIFVVSIVLITLFMGYHASRLEIGYEAVKIVPDNDPDMIVFKEFTKKFGEDGNSFIVGLENENLYKVDNFNRYIALCNAFKKLPGVKDVISIPTARILKKDTSVKRFITEPVFSSRLNSQTQLDGALKVFYNAKFYEGLIYNPASKATLAAVVIEKDVLNSVKRKDLIQATLDLSNQFAKETGVKVHYAGLPYVRFINLGLFKDEFQMLILLSSILTCLILYVLFRSFYALFFTVMVVIVTILWSMGFTVLLGYKITILTGMLPALIVIISIPNCIYMLNQYHQEYRKNQNQLEAVSKVIEKIGFITFMTNINTAIGFFVLLITDITMIYEFGMIAGIMSIATFIICLTVIPALFMFMPPPDKKQMLHLDKKTLAWMLNKAGLIIKNHRPIVYVATLILLILSGWGIYRLQAIAYIVDDFPENKTGIRSDLQFFESNFGGVMPLEIVINFNKKRAVYDIANLNKIDELENSLKTIVGLSVPLSVNRVVKTAVQAFYNNDSASYRLPTSSEKAFLALYLKKSKSEIFSLNNLVDSNGTEARISIKIADVGTIKMQKIVDNEVNPAIKSVFGDTDFKVNLTGTSLLFLKGNQYLIDDLGQSLAVAFFLISIMMAFLFTDIKIIFISLIPNIIPMIVTLGIMGWLDIKLKASTAVIFSTSFGITIDSTIHFLSKFKQEMGTNKYSVTDTVVKSLMEAGTSMLYTSGVLLIGFGIFIFSDFGQTVALGLLTCLALFFATFTNMILLPVLLISFVKRKDAVV